MKPFIWPWSCHRSCLNCAPDLDYRFGEIEIILFWFSCNGFARSTTLYLFISPWFIFLGFIDNYFIGPAWCVTPIGPFICNGTSLRYLTLKRLGFRQGRGIASADFFRETLKQKQMKFIFNNDKNKQKRRLWVSRNSRSGYLAAKLFTVNCAYFMKWTRKWNSSHEIKCASVS